MIEHTHLRRRRQARAIVRVTFRVQIQGGSIYSCRTEERCREEGGG